MTCGRNIDSFLRGKDRLETGKLVEYYQFPFLEKCCRWQSHSNKLYRSQNADKDKIQYHLTVL